MIDKNKIDEMMNFAKKNNINKDKVNDMLNNLSEDDKKKVNDVLNDKEKLNKILSNKSLSELLKKFGNNNEWYYLANNRYFKQPRKYEKIQRNGFKLFKFEWESWKKPTDWQRKFQL